MNTITADNNRLIRWLTYLMFMMFAMTTDAVGVIIPEIMQAFNLSMTEAGLIHYAPMAAIAISGLALGFLADKLGRKITITIGLGIFGIVCFFFVLGDSFYYFLSLMVLSGFSIGIFKSAALALIGDISTSDKEHTVTVNGVEAFFGVGAIIGPLIVTYFLTKGVDWKWLYFVAGILCVVLISIAVCVRYPIYKPDMSEPVSFVESLKLLKDKYAMGFSIGAALYVATESAIYVWMPTYLLEYEGSMTLLATYALTLFFVLRALGRFVGMWMLSIFNWAWVLVICCGVIMLCFIFSVLFGRDLAVFLLPLSGLFMSVVYPTINSKGISCFPRRQHGTAAGVILFFTALGAAAGPLIMGVVSDRNGGDPVYGFITATVFSALLFTGVLYNLVCTPVASRLEEIKDSQYSAC